MADYYLAEISSQNDYYPFGMAMPGREFSSLDYRYGFNDMEKDDEIKGNANSYTTIFRQYDSRIGRWLSVDPKGNLTPYESSYAGMGNNPILYTDPNGDFLPALLALGAVLYASFAEAPETDPNTQKDNAKVRSELSKVNFTIATVPIAGYKVVQTISTATSVKPNYRYVSDKEAELIKDKKEIPNIKPDGSPKPIYYSKDKFDTGTQAKDKLQLETTPTHRVEINPKNIQNPSKFSKVEGKPELGTGGGSEATTPNPIKVAPDKVIPIPNK